MLAHTYGVPYKNDAVNGGQTRDKIQYCLQRTSTLQCFRHMKQKTRRIFSAIFASIILVSMILAFTAGY